MMTCSIICSAKDEYNVVGLVSHVLNVLEERETAGTVGIASMIPLENLCNCCCGTPHKAQRSCLLESFVKMTEENRSLRAQSTMCHLVS